MPEPTPHPPPLAPRPYRGRFAPSPTGPLHFGSLIAAVGSYLDARSQQGEWWVRIDDIDPPREVKGAADDILKTLALFGFEWDGSITYQSLRYDLYRDAIHTLSQAGLAYPCGCSRKEIASTQNNANIYPGTCRNGLPAGKKGRLFRVNTTGSVISFTDGVFGPCRYDLETEIGDFIIHRADGYFSYQLATAIDDAEQGMSHVVRGCDLLDSTPRQIFLQQTLKLAVPAFIHLPVAVDALGQKLSKQNHAPSLANKPASLQLWNALVFLGLKPPTDMQGDSLTAIWQWAIGAWQRNNIPKEKHILYEALHSS